MWKPLIAGVVLLVGAAAVLPGAAVAGEADVLAVTVRKGGAGVYNFSVTVKHGDTGWKHYANKWDVVAPDGKILGTRVLYHPHESEQPFTRSLGGVKIPPSIATVTVRAHDLVHGYGGKELVVKLDAAQ